MNDKQKKEARDQEYHVEAIMDSFMGRIRKCKKCGTPTQFNHEKAKRFCPKGCFII